MENERSTESTFMENEREMTEEERGDRVTKLGRDLSEREAFIGLGDAVVSEHPIDDPRPDPGKQEHARARERRGGGKEGQKGNAQG